MINQGSLLCLSTGKHLLLSIKHWKRLASLENITLRTKIDKGGLFQSWRLLNYEYNVSMLTRAANIHNSTFRNIHIGRFQTQSVQKDHYKTLSIPRSASAKDIKNAYYKMAKKFHPDSNKGDPTATKKFQAISEAYEVLSNPKRREEYEESCGYRSLFDHICQKESHRESKSGDTARNRKDYPFTREGKRGSTRSNPFDYQQAYDIYTKQYQRRSQTAHQGEKFGRPDPKQETDSSRDQSMYSREAKSQHLRRLEEVFYQILDYKFHDLNLPDSTKKMIAKSILVFAIFVIVGTVVTSMWVIIKVFMWFLAILF